jgi:DNA polymerase II small subunit
LEDNKVSSEKLRKVVESIILAGYQLDLEAFKLIESVKDREDLNSVVREIVNEADKATPRPVIITRNFIEKVGIRLLPEKEVAKPTIEVGAPVPYAKEVESEVEIVEDPTEKIGSNATIEDFTSYFRDRFEKLTKILRQRLDVRDSMSIEDALKSPAGNKVKIIAMIMEKRERKRRLLMQIEDLENTATVLVPGETNSKLFEAAQKIPLDQVVCIEATRGRNDLFIAENFIFPDIPEKKIRRANEHIYAVLLSDIHLGSKTFIEKALGRLILWLNGKIGSPDQREMALRTKYVIIAGDLVDGVGVYPGQEEELNIQDIYEQYRLAARFIEQIPDYMEVILIPGNHDAVRQALPQPAIPREFAEPVYEARKIISLGNPAEVKLHGVHFLIYHGRSLDDVVATIPNMSFQEPVKAMEFLLKCRHLAPEFGRRTSIAPERRDYLVIERLPDVFQSGHLHVARYENYRGTLVVNCGAWQYQTNYQRKMGLKPTPGVLPILNLQNMEITMMNFLS